MKDLLELILKNITTHPEEVVIEESQEDNRDVFTITVNPEDMGRVIGKSGKVIRAIRSLAHVVAIRQGKRFRINVAEVNGSSDVSDASESAPVAEVTEEPETAKPSEEKSTEAPEEVKDDMDLIEGAIDVAEANQEVAEKEDKTAKKAK